MRLTNQIHHLGTETAFEVLARAKGLEARGRSILHLEIGEPDFPTPPHIVEAGVRALSSGATKYAPAAGIAELREAIAQWAGGRGLFATPENVLVTSGAKPMLFYALTALIDPGDEVLIPDPGFPIYESLVRFAFGRPVTYSVDAARRHAVDTTEIAKKISRKTRVLVLNSPHNPTGAVLDSATLQVLADLVERHRLTVVSDEIYSQLVFEGEHRSIGSLSGMAERTVVIDGFSKAYAMAGWRLGYGVLPSTMVRYIERYIINTTSCAPPFVQKAGVVALTGPQACVTEMRDEYRARRDFVVASLNRLEGVSCAVPRGAFYAFPSISGVLQGGNATADDFAEALLDTSGLACLPGSAFGTGGAQHLRLSFAASWPTLEMALDVLNGVVKARRSKSAV
jgi:aspartate/methionine/tyrosine aminotransferase